MTVRSLTAAVLGGTGYIGGELLRLLVGHPAVMLAAATSRRMAGRRVDGVHPNLRGLTDLTFIPPDALDSYDILFLAAGHRDTMGAIGDMLPHGKHVIDLSGDFRLRNVETYATYYGVPHVAADLVSSFVTGLPELHRDEIAVADRISVPGCMATAAILALHPLARAGLIDGTVTVDARTGSSGSGSHPGPENLHAERSGAMRVFAPAGHRHEAEIAQATGHPIRMSATGIEAVRGVQVLCRATTADGVDAVAIRDAYRGTFAGERFVRVVAARRGGYRLPEPKILAGSNFCDVGYAVDGPRRSVVAIGALDNLMKGGSGNAVQCMNIRAGLPEHLGLEFAGLHP